MDEKKKECTEHDRVYPIILKEIFDVVMDRFIEAGKVFGFSTLLDVYRKDGKGIDYRASILNSLCAHTNIYTEKDANPAAVKLEIEIAHEIIGTDEEREASIKKLEETDGIT